MSDLNLMVCLSSKGNILFEPATHLKSGFIQSKKYYNSVYIKTGKFPEYLFNKDCCRQATETEIKQYIEMKENSPHLLAIS